MIRVKVLVWEQTSPTDDVDMIDVEAHVQTPLDAAALLEHIATHLRGENHPTMMIEGT